MPLLAPQPQLDSQPQPQSEPQPEDRVVCAEEVKASAGGNRDCQVKPALTGQGGASSGHSKQNLEDGRISSRTAKVSLLANHTSEIEKPAPDAASPMGHSLAESPVKLGNAQPSNEAATR